MKTYRQTLLYFRLKSKSYYRLWKEFPWVIRLLLLGGFFIITYILIISHLDVSLINYIVSSGVYILLGLKLCWLNPSEATLLKVLQIPRIQIRLTKCLFLSMPFFLLDIYAGLIAITLGTGIVVLMANKRTNQKIIRSFYKATSYQWLSMFRSEGCWLLLAGYIFLMIALFHGNRNMACFSLVWLFLIPCLAAYYRQRDPKQWLRVYNNTSFLLRKKMIEMLQNTIILLIVCVPLVLIFDWSAYWLYIQLFLLLILGNVLLFYGYYACYPGMLTAMVLTGIVIFILGLVYVMAPVFFIPAGLLLLVILHIISIQNLKSAIYGISESTH